MGGLFSSKKKKEPEHAEHVLTKKDEAILELKRQRNRLKNYNKGIQGSAVGTTTSQKVVLTEPSLHAMTLERIESRGCLVGWHRDVCLVGSCVNVTKQTGCSTLLARVENRCSDFFLFLPPRMILTSPTFFRLLRRDRDCERDCSGGGDCAEALAEERQAKGAARAQEAQVPAGACPPARRAGATAACSSVCLREKSMTTQHAYMQHVPMRCLFPAVVTLEQGTMSRTKQQPLRALVPRPPHYSLGRRHHLVPLSFFCLLLLPMRVQGLLEQTENQMFNLERMISEIEQVAMDAKVFEALKAGNEALQQLQRETSVEDVEKLMEDSAEAVAAQDVRTPSFNRMPFHSCLIISFPSLLRFLLFCGALFVWGRIHPPSSCYSIVRKIP